MMRLPTKASGTIGILVLIALLSSVAVMSAFTVYHYDNFQSTTVHTTTTHLVDNYVNNLFEQANVSLNLKVLNPDGSVVKNVTYPDDIITNNLINLFAALWNGNNCPSLPNVASGTSESMCYNSGWDPYTAYFSVCNGCNTYYYVVDDGGYIGVGTGTTAPARTDHSLQTQVGSWSHIDPPTITGNSVFVASGITLTSSATITEAGFAEQFGGNCAVGNSGGPACGNLADTTYMFLFFHDTFSGISVSADQTIQVQYTLNFPSGTNENILSYVASMMQFVTGTSATNVGTMVDSTGAVHNAGTLTFWASTYNSAPTGLLTYSALPMIQVGTSSTAPTSLDYELNAQVGLTTNLPTETVDATNYNIMWHNTITLTSATTVQEAGFFYDGEWSGTANTQGSVHFLFFHSLTGAVSIPANNAITTQFTVQF